MPSFDSSLIFSFLAIPLGITLLVYSSNWFVNGAIGITRYFNVSPLIIGMVIVGFGTSMPEVLVSISGALQGSPGIALGNVYGSNIINISLILGVSALISPIIIQSKILRRELPLLTFATFFSCGIALYFGEISRIYAVGHIVLLIAILYWMVHINRTVPAEKDLLSKEINEEILSAPALSLPKSTFWLLTGIGLLIMSSKILVGGAVVIAKTFGISDLVIGLTVIALGTSLPELASSVQAARKNQHDIAIGNIIGSNLFNTLAVLGAAGTIMPLPITPEIIYRDLPIMIFVTLILFPIIYPLRGKNRPCRINRWEGGILLTFYIVYTLVLFFQAKQA